MYQLSLGLFAVAAVAGLTMAIMHFRGTSPPKTVLAVLHGLFAASGLIVLLLALIKAGFGGKPGIAFGRLAAAALGGFVLVSSHVQKKRLPSGLGWVIPCWQSRLRHLGAGAIGVDELIRRSNRHLFQITHIQR
jgi:hypothetical protein